MSRSQSVNQGALEAAIDFKTFFGTVPGHRKENGRIVGLPIVMLAAQGTMARHPPVLKEHASKMPRTRCLEPDASKMPRKWAAVVVVVGRAPTQTPSYVLAKGVGYQVPLRYGVGCRVPLHFRCGPPMVWGGRWPPPTMKRRG